MAFILSGCGAFKTLDKMGKGMDTVSSSMTQMAGDLKKTSGALGGLQSAFQQQALAMGLQMMFDPNNTKYVSPSSTTPTSMIPGGQAIASAGQPDDIVGLFYLWLLEINQSQPDPMTADSERECDRQKWIKLTAIQIVSALLTQEKVEQIIKTEMGGIYVDSVTAMLLARYLFDTSFRLENGFLAISTVNPNGFQAAIEIVKSVEFIENLPYKDKLQIKLIGFFDLDKVGLNQTVALPKDPVTPGYWKKLKEKFGKEMDPVYKGTPDYLKVQHEIEDRVK